MISRHSPLAVVHLVVDRVVDYIAGILEWFHPAEGHESGLHYLRHQIARLAGQSGLESAVQRLATWMRNTRILFGGVWGSRGLFLLLGFLALGLLPGVQYFMCVLALFVGLQESLLSWIVLVIVVVIVLVTLRLVVQRQSTSRV